MEGGTRLQGGAYHLNGGHVCEEHRVLEDGVWPSLGPRPVQLVLWPCRCGPPRCVEHLVEGFGFRFQGSGFRGEGLGFERLGFEFEGLGFRV